MKTLKNVFLSKRIMVALGLIVLCLATKAQTPLSINGQLKVVNNKLVNECNQPIQLRGISTHGLNYFGINANSGIHCYKASALDLMKNWGVDILRISMYIQEGGYETNKTAYTNEVVSLVNMARDRGMYALVDFHQLTPGDPNYNLANAQEFFTSICNTLKDHKNVIYDICNEPNGVTWNQIKTYADQVIPTIKAIDNDAVILVGTHGWASLGVSDGKSYTDITNNPLSFTNIMYTFHFYAASHGTNYLNMLKAAVNAGLPIFVTEFGAQQASGDNNNDFVMTQQYLDYLAQEKISWCYWNFSDDDKTGAIWKHTGWNPTTSICNQEAWTDANLKEAGVWIKGKFSSPADNFPSCGTVDCNGDPDGTAYLDNCNNCVGGNTKKIGYSPNGVYDNVTKSENDMGGLDGGIYYWDLPNGTTQYPNFVGVKNRDVNNNEQQYTITQPAGEYTPVGLSFGTVTEPGPNFGQKSTVDLSGDAKLNITFTNKSNTDINVSFAISDSLGNLIDHHSGASVVTPQNFTSEAYKYAITMAVSAGSTVTKTFDFAGGYHANYGINQMEQNCDIKLITGINYTVTNANLDNSWAPLELNQALISIDKFTLGLPGPAVACIPVNNVDHIAQSKGIYPNPTEDVLFFENVQVKNISIMDVNGRTVYQGFVTNKIDVSNFDAGVYYIIDTQNGQKKMFIKK